MKLDYLHFLEWQKMYCIYCHEKIAQPLLDEHPNKGWTQIPHFRQRLYWIVKRHLKAKHPEHFDKLK
jgi:hypothetical protein